MQYTKFIIFGIIAASLLTMSLSTFQIADAKKSVKCNNIKILVKVSNPEVNATYTANLTLGTGFKSKSVTAEDNISTTIPIMFHKIQPCPPIGFEYTGNVNGTDFTGKITSLQKPNRVAVEVS